MSNRARSLKIALSFFVLLSCSAAHAVKSKLKPPAPKVDCFVFAKSVQGSIAKKLQSFMSCKASEFSGAVLVGYDHDADFDSKKDVLFKGAYGFQNRDDKHLKANQIATPFLLGSVTKQFTAAMTLREIADGKLRVDENVSNLISRKLLPDPGKWKNEEILNLMDHSSGIPDYLYQPTFDEINAKKMNSDDILRRMSVMKLMFAPGEEGHYSSTNYLILGKILEGTFGMPWAQIVDSYIAKPLGLSHTGVYKFADIDTAYAIGYVPAVKNGKKTFEKALYRDPDKFAAVGDIYSNVDDLFTWLHDLFSTEKIVPVPLREQYLKLGAIYNPEHRSYFTAGGEWKNNLARLPKKAAIFKTGHLNGFANIVTYFPEEKLVVVVLSNIHEYNVTDLMEQLAAIVFDSPASQEQETLISENRD